MDQTAAAADALLKTPTYLSGLLAQTSTTTSETGLFSDLLSETSNLETVLAAQSHASQITPVSDTISPSSTTQSPELLQTLNNFSSTLHKVLNVLRQQTRDSSASSAPLAQNKSSNTIPISSDSTASNTQAAAKTFLSTATHKQNEGGFHNKTKDDSSDTTLTSTSVASSTGAGQNTATASLTTSTSTTASTSAADTQTLSTIIAELLALTQAVTQNLQLTKTGTGNVNSGPKSLLSTDEVATNEAGTTNSLAAALGQAVNSLTTEASSSAAPTTSSDTAAPPADLFVRLLTDLQKTLQKLTPNTVNATTQVTPTSSAVDLSTSGASAQVASQAMALNKFVTSVQQQSSKTTSNVALTSLISKTSDQTTPDARPASAIQTQTTINASASLAVGTNKGTIKVSSDPLQNQILSSEASLSEQSVSPSPTSGQVFANAAAWIGIAEKNSGASADSASDFLNQDKNSSSYSAAAITDNNAAAVGVTQATGTYNFASTLSALRAANGGTVGLPTAADQVILQMSRNIKSGNDQMSLQLQPGDLGKITIKLDISSDGKVQGIVTAEHPQTLDMLQKDSRSLERALQDAGLRADPGSLQFSLGGGNQNNTGQTAQGNNAGGLVENGTVSAGDDTGLVETGTTSENYYITPTGVNIHV